MLHEIQKAADALAEGWPEARALKREAIKAGVAKGMTAEEVSKQIADRKAELRSGVPLTFGL